MSGLQTAVKPHLLPLIKGEWPILDQDAQKRLATWATMFTMVAEFADIPTIAIAPEERLQLKETLIPRDHWRMWIGRFKGKEFEGGIWHRGFALRWSEIVSGHADSQSIVFAAGKVIFVVASTTAANTPIHRFRFSDQMGLQLFWPREHQILSAPLKQNTDADFKLLGPAFSEFALQEWGKFMKQ